MGARPKNRSRQQGRSVAVPGVFPTRMAPTMAMERHLSKEAGQRTGVPIPTRLDRDPLSAHRCYSTPARGMPAFHPEPTPERVPSVRFDPQEDADSGLSRGELLRKGDYLKSGDGGVAF
jgi:hypothetical protein